jgi:hypothetical protein
MPSSVDQRVFGVDDVGTVFPGVVIEVEDQVLECDVGGGVLLAGPPTRIRGPMLVPVNPAFRCREQQMVSLDVDKLLRPTDKTDASKVAH